MSILIPNFHGTIPLTAETVYKAVSPSCFTPLTTARVRRHAFRLTTTAVRGRPSHCHRICKIICRMEVALVEGSFFY